MAVTEAVALAPIAYTFCANALRQSDASLESAAQVCGAGPLRILVRRRPPDAAAPDRLQLGADHQHVHRNTERATALRAARRHPGVLDVPLHQRSAVHRPRLRGARRGLRSSLSSRWLVAVQAKLLKDSQRFVSVRGKATRPQLRPGLDQVARRPSSRLPGLRGAAADRRVDLPVVHLGADPAAVTVLDDDLRELQAHLQLQSIHVDRQQGRDRLHRRGLVSFWPRWRCWSPGVRRSGSTGRSSIWRWHHRRCRA